MATHNVSEVFGFFPNYLDYCTNSTFTCNDPTPPCRSPDGLRFSTLWTITQNYYNACTSTGAWLFNSTTSADAHESLALTQSACYSIAGTSWTRYAKADIWSRLTTWKFPLIQLIAVSPRPPLGLTVELLSVFHLAADPIGCLSDLVWKFECCQRRAVFWQTEIWRNKISSRAALLPGETAQQERLWEAITIITESYNELGENFGDDAEHALLRALETKPVDGFDNDPQDARRKLLAECLTTGGALAADRATGLLPVLIALAIFISLIFIDIIKLQPSGQYNPSITTYINIEMHSIGFSALFYWLIPTVAMTAVIGTSQTEEAIPRILRRFHRDLKNAKIDIPLPDIGPTKVDLRHRWMHGGIYNWQPLARHRMHTVRQNVRSERLSLQHKSGVFAQLQRALLPAWPSVYLFLPVVTFLAAILTGMLNSGFVPPKGWSCRSWAELAFAFGWIVSYVLSVTVSRWLPPGRGMFYVMLVKDLAVTGAVFAWVLVTTFGFNNRCDCYSRYGHIGVTLPEQPETYTALQEGLGTGGSFVTNLVLGILFQLLVVPGLLLARYTSAFATFTQRDKSSGEPAVLDAVSRSPSKAVHHGDGGRGERGGNGGSGKGGVSATVQRQRSHSVSPLSADGESVGNRHSLERRRGVADREAVVSGLSEEEIELARLISRSLESDVY